MDEGVKDVLGKLVLMKCALGMPLHADGKGEAAHLGSLHNAVGCAGGSELQAVSEPRDSLMVAAVDAGLGATGELVQTGARGEIHGVKWGELATDARVGHFRGLLCGEILDERTAEPDVHGLKTVTDAEDGLAEVECVLKEQLIGGFTGGVGRVGAVLHFAVFGGIDIGSAPGQKHALAGGQRARNLLGSGRK